MAEANFSLTNILSSPTVTGDTHVLIDTIQCSLFDMEIPSIPPSLSVIGRVHSKAEKMGDGIHLGCELDVSKYVRDAMHEFKIHCSFDMSLPRWRKAPAPYPNTYVSILGQLSCQSPNRALGLVTDNIILNLGAGRATTAASYGDRDGTPYKKRKFGTFQPVSTPQTAMVKHTSSAVSYIFQTSYPIPPGPIPGKTNTILRLPEPLPPF